MRSVVFLAVCALGVSSLVTQLTLMRELLSVLSGNELVFGIVLGNWLLLTGLGSYLGQTASRLRRPALMLVLAELAVATLPALQVYLIRVLRNVVFVPGVEVGLLETAVSSALLLLPYCVLGGYLLTFACCLLAGSEGPVSLGRVYFMDNLGDIAGGVAFSVGVVVLSNHFQLLILPAALNVIAALAVAWVFRDRLALGVALAVGTTALAVGVTVDLNQASLARQYAGAEVLFQGQSAYGSLVVTESEGQRTFFESGVPLLSTETPEQGEETVHYALAQRPDARRVLLISGGATGSAREALKWGVETVDYVELDPLIVEATRRFAPGHLDDPRIRVIADDGRRFVQRTDRRYDVVIADLPDPDNLQLNRFYTREFLEEVSRILNPGGVFSLSLAQYENYVSAELAGLLSVAQRTLRSVFAHSRIIPGQQVYFLASNGPLDADIVERLQRHQIEVQLLQPSYLRAILADDRVGDIERSLESAAPVNRDWSPILQQRQIAYWASQFGKQHGAFALVLLLLLGAYLVRSGPVPLAVFSGGCAASALQVVVLLGFQVVHGYVYQQVGAIVTLFIVGLAVGSYTMTRRLPRRPRLVLVALAFGVALFAALVPSLLDALAALAAAGGSWWSAAVGFPLLAFVPGVLVGMEFPVASHQDYQGVARTAARLYTADFVGAALGATVAGAMLIPVLSVGPVCMIVAGLNLLSGATVWLTARA